MLTIIEQKPLKKSITNDDFRWLFMIFWKASKMFSKGILRTKNGLETSLTLFSSQISLTDKSRAYKKYHQIPLKSCSYNGFGPERQSVGVLLTVLPRNHSLKKSDFLRFTKKLFDWSWKHFRGETRLLKAFFFTSLSYRGID